MRPSLFRSVLTASTALAATLTLAGTAHAQAADQSATSADEGQPAGLEEIVVTAQKRSENLQSVPIAISAFTADALARRNISDVSSVAKLAPNVTLDSGSFAGGSASVLSAYIRGIGQSDFAFNFDPGVGVYLDGVYLGRTIGANVGLFDVERIEVLKGPQGTLFGRNTIGGAVNIVTMTPGDKFKATAEVTTGRYNRLDVRGLVSAPLTDNLSASFAFGTKHRDGYMKRIAFPTGGFVTDANPFTPRIASSDREGGQGEYNLRGKLHWSNGSGLDVVASADYSSIRTSNVPQSLLRVDPAKGLGSLYNACINVPAPVLDVIGLGALCGPRAVIGTSLAGVNVDADPSNDRLPMDGRFLTGNRDTTYSTGNSLERTKSYGGSLVVTADIGSSAAIKSISSYRKLDFLSAADLDGMPIDILEINSRVHQRQYSQELQLTGKAMSDQLKYVFGLYYFDEKSATDDYVDIAALLLINAPAALHTKAKAAYGQIDWALTEQVGLTLGARYTEENKTIFVGQQDLNAISYKLVPGCFPIPVDNTACRAAAGGAAGSFPNADNPFAYAPSARPSQKFTNFSPKIGLQYHIDDKTMLYASWSRGYKSGGWTTRLSNPVRVIPSFKPEKAESWELGLKADMLDNRLRINTAGFYTKYKGIQLNFQEGVSPVIKNAGDAKIYGFELEATARVTEGFTLNGAVGYVHNEYTRLDPGSIGITLASQLPKTPKWKFSISPQYEMELANGGSVSLGVDYSHITSSFNDAENTPIIKKAASDDLSASLTYKAPEHWQVTVGGTNILNDRYLTAGQGQLEGVGIDYGTYNRPAEWYAKVRVDF